MTDDGSPHRDQHRPPTQSSVLSPQSFAGLLLIAALVAAILVLWSNPQSKARYDVQQAETLLQQKRYSQAVALLERTLITYDTPQVRLLLSYAYLARRGSDRAERQARRVIETGPADAQPAALAQLGRVLAFEGQGDEALSAWTSAIRAANPFADI